MIFNSSFLIGLTLSTLALHSPLLINSPNLLSTSIYFQNLNLRKFSFHALYFNSPLSNLSIHKSHFEHFLERPISILQNDIDCTSLHNQEFVSHKNAPCGTITYCTFRNIESSTNGGAYSITYSAETTTIFDHCIFESCSSKTNGGALSFDIQNIDMNLLGILIVTSCRFDRCYVNNTSNKSETFSGGSIYCNGRSLNLANTTFSFSQIISQVGKCCGGAIYAKLVNADQTFFYNNFDNCILPNMSDPSNSQGGAIYLSEIGDSASSTVQLFSCLFQSCKADQGSTLYSEKGTNLVINATQYKKLEGNTMIHLDGSDSTYGICIKSLGFSNIKYNYFIFIRGEYKLNNKRDDSGLLYIDDKMEFSAINFTFPEIPDLFTFINRDKLSNMPSYTYSEPAYTATSEINQDISTEEYGHSSSIIITSNNNSYTDFATYQTISGTSSASIDSGDIIDGATDGNKKSGLSTLAIIFIVIACVIFVVGLIIASILIFHSKDGCYRNTCTGSSNYLGKRESYF